jgi:hypothetical protein
MAPNKEFPSWDGLPTGKFVASTTSFLDSTGNSGVINGCTAFGWYSFFSDFFGTNAFAATLKSLLEAFCSSAGTLGLEPGFFLDWGVGC